MVNMQVDIIFNGFQQRLLVDQKLYTPNVAIVTLDASIRSTLNWKASDKEARELVENGYDLIWEFDFDFESLQDEAGALALELAVDHFSKTVWSQFGDYSLGVILYRGAHPSLNELKLLAAHLPDLASSFVALDLTDVSDPATYFQRTRQDLYGHLRLIVEGEWPQRYPYAIPALTPSFLLPAPERRISLAFYLSEEGSVDSALIESITVPFRVIPEKLLTYEWEGIDELIVCSKDVSDRGRRKLLGFCAAGGRVLTVGEPLGLPSEEPL